MIISGSVKFGRYDAGLKSAYAFGRSGNGTHGQGVSEVNAVLTERNEAMGKKLADRAADLVAASIGTKSGQWAAARRAQSTGRLVRATADRRNIQATAGQVGVGKPAWLNQSNAKYWRQFEEGFEGHVGSPIRFIGKTTADVNAPLSVSLRSNGKRRSERPRLHTGPGIPFVRAFSPIRYSANHPITTIDRPIEAHNVYRNLIDSGEAFSFLQSQAKEFYTRSAKIIMSGG